MQRLNGKKLDARGRVWKGRTPEQKKRNAESVTRWKKKNPEHAKEIMDRADKKHRVKPARQAYMRFAALKKYGLTVEQYTEMVSRQDGKCYICGNKPKTLCVDHDHVTGQIRKLLCRSCNSVLGLMKNNSELLHKAAEYLQGHE